MDSLLIMVAMSIVHHARHIYLPSFSFFGVTSNQIKAYVLRPRKVNDMKVSIREETATVQQGMSVNVMWVWQEGRHPSDIIFRN